MSEIVGTALIALIIGFALRGIAEDSHCDSFIEHINSICGESDECILEYLKRSRGSEMRK